MANGTQDRIAETALELFSQYGCSGTSMNDIAHALGLSKAALYKHYTSKEQIRARLLEGIGRYYEERFGSAAHPLPVPDSAEAFFMLAAELAEFTVRDENIVKMRRMLTLEQFRDKSSAALATAQFNTRVEEIFTALFLQMQQRGLLAEGDSAMLALAFTAPVASLIRLSDREPEKTEAVLEQIRAFIRHFIAVYGKTQA